ncbi:hypothetical protein AVEN_79314-1 [Araneus ventricosus]|uniref:Uncharacterized protein n=1 Tax=Araneus ventricosus TaxID=182803 RepID=A0A4Y2K0K0_ARAVE|nr:hypothetical protein AVEN_79314-1 [Araneus ventricosus]
MAQLIEHWTENLLVRGHDKHGHITWSNLGHGADSDSDKEATDMCCEHQQIEISAEQTLGKIGYIIAHS